MVIPERQGKCCDAVVKHIERSSRALRTDIIDPEQEGGDGRVDLQVTVAGQVYALEHTRVQPFERRIELATEYRRIRDLVEAWFPLPLPGPAFYQLHIPPGTHPPGWGKAGERRLASLRAWIEKSVRALHSRAPRRPQTPRHLLFMDMESGRPNGWRCEFTVARSSDGIVYPTREAGSLHVYIGNPDDLEGAFIDQVRKAFDNKCPKLARCKDEVDGARTVLILEVIEQTVGDDFYIAKHLPALLAACPTTPDDIFLVYPKKIPFWQVWVAKRGEDHWPDERMPMPHKGYQTPPTVPPGYPLRLAEALGLDDQRHLIPAEWEPYFPVEDDLEDLKAT